MTSVGARAPAVFPIPPPLLQLQFVDPRTGKLTRIGQDFLQLLWASIMGVGGIWDLLNDGSRFAGALEMGREPADGEQGFPGQPGVNGSDGPPGMWARDGVDGMDGFPGLSGPAGADGLSLLALDGRDGRDGMDGLPFANLPGAFSQSVATGGTAPNSLVVYTMAGLAGSITPQRNGNVVIIMSGTIDDTSSTNANDGIGYQISYGTGTAPTGNAALTGTQIGCVQTFTEPTSPAAAADVAMPFCIAAVVGGLVVGTTYWLDLANIGITTANQHKVAHVSITAFELP
jgi:hypothetical protein